MTILLDNGDEFGVPAKMTRVYTPENQAPFLPAPMRNRVRQGALDRHARYRERKRLKKLLGAK